MSQFAQTYKHVDTLDVDGSGIKKEVLIVKRWESGTISYIDLSQMDVIDKKRIKQILDHPSAQAGTVPLYQIMASHTINNGMLALDYYHPSCKEYRPLSFNGVIRGGLDNITITAEDTKIIGSDFTNLSDGTVVGAAPEWTAGRPNSGHVL